MLTTLETLDVQRVIERETGERQDYGLDPPRFKVAFRLAGETAIKTPQRRQQDADRTDIYAQVEGEPKVFLISAYIEDSLNRTTFDLREKTVLKFARDAVDAMTIDVTGSPSVALAKKGEDWRLTKPVDAHADFGTADGIVGRLEQAKMKSIVAATDAHGAGRREEVRPRQAPGHRDGRRRIDARVARDRREAEDGSLYARDLSRPLVFTVEAGAARRSEEEAGRPPREGRVRVPILLGARPRSHRRRPDVLVREGEGQPVKDQSAADDVWKQKKPAAKDVDQTKFTDLLTTLSNLARRQVRRQARHRRRRHRRRRQVGRCVLAPSRRK